MRSCARFLRKIFNELGKVTAERYLDTEGAPVNLPDKGYASVTREYDEEGNLLGIWGAMSDLSRSFLPWEDGFTKGLYLAGVECVDDAEAPDGWTKWVIPGYEYLYVECEGGDTFPQVIKYLEEKC